MLVNVLFSHVEIKVNIQAVEIKVITERTFSLLSLSNTQAGICKFTVFKETRISVKTYVYITFKVT